MRHETFEFMRLFKGYGRGNFDQERTMTNIIKAMTKGMPAVSHLWPETYLNSENAVVFRCTLGRWIHAPKQNVYLVVHRNGSVDFSYSRLAHLAKDFEERLNTLLVSDSHISLDACKHNR